MANELLMQLLSLVGVRDEGLIKESVIDGINGVEAMFTSSRDIGT